MESFDPCLAGRWGRRTGGLAPWPVLGGCAAARRRPPTEGRGGAWRRRGSGAVRRPSWRGTRAALVVLVLAEPDPRAGHPDPDPDPRVQLPHRRSLGAR